MGLGAWGDTGSRGDDRIPNTQDPIPKTQYARTAVLVLVCRRRIVTLATLSETKEIAYAPCSSPGGAGYHRVASFGPSCFARQARRVTVIDDLSTGSMDNIRQCHQPSQTSGSSGDSVRNEQVMTVLAGTGRHDLSLWPPRFGVQLIVDQPDAYHRDETSHGSEVVAENLANKFRTPVLIASNQRGVTARAKRCRSRKPRTWSTAAPRQPVGLRVLQGDRRVPWPGVFRGEPVCRW